jgi:hypothetical protein
MTTSAAFNKITRRLREYRQLRADPRNFFLLEAFAILQKAIINFVMSAYIHLGSQREDFREILYFRIFESVNKFKGH